MQKTEIIRVSELNRYLKNLISSDPRLQDIRVGGELSNFKHHRSGHMYFTLKDSQSSLRCVFFRGKNTRCLFQPADGMEVVISGNLSVYEPDGVYQLYVNEMEPAGVGSLYLAFEQLKEKLAAEGLFVPENKQKLPFAPRKIGLITSPTGAALQDMLTVFKKRFPALHLVVVESLVQGLGASADLVRALDLLNKLPGIELIILARGGGSLEDLWPFNEEQVARAKSSQLNSSQTRCMRRRTFGLPPSSSPKLAGCAIRARAAPSASSPSTPRITATTCATPRRWS